MPTVHRIPMLAAAVLLSAMAAATAAPIPPAPAPAPTKPVPAQSTDPTSSSAASQEPLRIGLSDSSTKLVLPWFITELKDAVNERKSVEETAKGLAQGF